MRLLRILLHRPVGLVALLAIVVLCSPRNILTTTAETQIQWTAATSSQKDHPADTAPKSQRYWDQHRIARPDYAKTDAEIAAERLDRMVGGSAGTMVFLQKPLVRVAALLVLGAVLILFVMSGGRRLGFADMKLFDGTGHRLGGSRFRFFHRTTTAATTSSSGPNSITTQEEQTRLARLARFEATSVEADKSKSE